MEKSVYETFLSKIASVLLYGFSSFTITVINKIVLTSHGFPSYAALGVSQMVFIVCLIGSLHVLKLVRVAGLSRSLIRKIYVLPILYLMNLFFGLGGTKAVSLPMFVVLRRFTIPLTMLLEYTILRQKPSITVMLSVGVMIFGALLAAMYDLGFNLAAYTFIFANNVATASNNVTSKLKLSNKDIDKQSLVFYNCLVSIIPLSVWIYFAEDVTKITRFESWSDSSFLVSFFLSCSSAYLLLISTNWCIEKNGALTTTVVGVLKNSIVTYLGMVIGGDYLFNWPNFSGVTVSLIGAVIYSSATMKRPAQKIKEMSKETSSSLA